MADWNARYRQSDQANQPAQMLLDHPQLLANQGGCALELACGLGGNALFLAERGYDVDCWDQSTTALKKLEQFAQEAGLTAKIHTKAIDLEQAPLPQIHNAYDLVIISYYLHRPLMATIKRALKPGGLVFYQTFCRDKISAGGPNNPDFLLKPNELLELFSDFNIVQYSENQAIGDTKSGLRNQAYLIAAKP